MAGSSWTQSKWSQNYINGSNYANDLFPTEKAKKIFDTKWLNNDYVKFIALGQRFIEENDTPLIISGQSGKSTKLYEVCDILAKQLERGEASGEVTKMSAIMGEEITETGDYIVNEKDKVVTLTQDGVKKVEQFFQIDNLSDPENLEIQHNINLALRAHSLMHRDQDYVVKDDEVLIVDVKRC